MADYQANLQQLEDAGAAVYAITTDDEAHARETAEKHGLTFPVLYGVDGPALSQAWGSYYEEKRNVLHATAFILRPGGTIASATYSTGPVGRLTPGEAAGIVAFYQK